MALTAFALEDDKRDDVRALYDISSEASLKEFRHNFEETFKSELGADSYRTCILSGEHCSSRLLQDSEIARLHKFLHNHFDKISVVAYFRRQDEFLLSTYSTAVKFGETRPCLIPDELAVQQRYEYDVILDRWARQFGKENIIARRFVPELLANGDIVDDFCDLTELVDTSHFVRPPRLNESLDVVTLEFLRLFNAHVPFMTKDRKINKLRGNIVEILQSISVGPRVSLERESLDAFMKQFVNSNTVVATTYFGVEPFPSGDPLFGPRQGSDNRHQMRDLSRDELMAVVARIWEAKQGKEQLNRPEFAGGSFS